MRNKSLNTCRFQGHTIMEMVVVLTILVLLWGMAAPRYANFTTRYRAEAAARRIAADLTLARQQAVQSSSNVAVVFDLTHSTYTLTGVASLDHQSSSTTVTLTADPYKATLATVPFTASTVTFNAYGSADQSGTVQVQAGGYQWNITLEATAGKVAVTAS